jgi:sugar phosphate isomerase/epimerase
MRFGISSHLYHDLRLSRNHLAEVAASGFETLELFATRSHFDYHDPAALDLLTGWMEETGLRLHGIHAPMVDRFGPGAPGRYYYAAAADQTERELAVREAVLSLDVARRLPVSVLVLHLGLPPGQPAATRQTRDAARRSIDAILEESEPLGIRLAIEVIPNEISTAEQLVDLLEQEIDHPGAGVCLDFGHAFLQGDVADAIETVSGHLVSTHVHDNHGSADDHLAPFDGDIDWPSAMMALQKVGYDGTLLLELANVSGDTGAVLRKAQQARARLEALLANA